MINTSIFQTQNRAPTMAFSTTPEIKIFDIRYIGWVKKRSNGSQTAYGWHKGEWSIVFSKAVLHEWFGIDERPGEAATLYNVLGIKQEATAEEVKTAYRRLAKQWHPDRCKEADARRQFEAIQSAYDVLGDQIRRAKYNAGLMLMARIETSTQQHLAYSESDLIYRSPLRCGLILCEAARTGNRWTVTKILQWQDIVNQAGQTLVTSWKSGADTFTEDWV